MLDFLQGKASNRKLRLFACAWWRRMACPLSDNRCSTAVETAERYADGLVPEEERLGVWEAARRVLEDAVVEEKYEQAALAQDAALCLEVEASRWLSLHPLAYRSDNTSHIICEILGNPFRPVTLDPAWRTPAVVQLARSLYEERRFEDMPVLADALEEAGCQDAAVLEHCRGPGPHVRGCWVVDLVLGKG
jgi:hypothetical protein